MAQRTPTAWDSNTSKNVGITYNNSSVTYNSSSTAYSSSTTTLDDFGKLASSWSKPVKIASGWMSNPAALVSLYLFDSASHTFDSAVDTFDGIVTGQDFTNTNLPAAWAKGSKIASNWEANPSAIVNEYIYDSASRLHDSATRTYDGGVTGADTVAQKVPAAWSKL